MTSPSSWTVWGLVASVCVTDSAMAAAAQLIVADVIASVDDACSRFRQDSELLRIQADLAAGTKVSELLAELVEGALAAAGWTNGDVDPTLGKDLDALGYDRDIAAVQLAADLTGTTMFTARRRTAGWEQVFLDGQMLTVPGSLRLDLGATAKAIAADMAAQRVHAELGCGVLVSLGGDIATAGSCPEGGWQILAQDLPVDPWQQVSLGAGKAMATSSTQKRRWKRGGVDVHHILDPRFGLPAEPVWRSVTVAAASCLRANAMSTAGVVRGFAAVEWFTREGISARLVDQQGRLVTTSGWPKESSTTPLVQHHG